MENILILSDKLKSIALKTIKDCTFEKTASYFEKTEKMQLLLPSGDEKYYSFWIRDIAMMAQSGLVSNSDLKRYVEVVASCGQNGENTVFLKNELVIPPFAVADHINYDGKAVFFPGTYSANDDQGDGSYGFFPPFCDNFYFIIMVCQYIKQSKDHQILQKEYGGLTLLTRIEKAFACYNIDDSTGLCISDAKKHTVDWGFVDSVKKSGKLLMASILRYNAGVLLFEVLDGIGKKEKCKILDAETQKIKKNIIDTFYDSESGWFYSATEFCHQYDVWATAYAVFSNIATEEKTLEALWNGYRDKTAVVDGQVRSILTTNDFSVESAWEYSIAKMNTYQNGAYWATPTGWYAYALYKYNKRVDILSDFCAHFEAYKDMGAPFEWIDAKTENYSGLRYGTSGVLPYIGILKIIDDMM